MDILPIAELRPELPELDSKHIKAIVSLVWPYSSAQREFALLLTEPDFRLRLKKGQTRVRFTRSCAKAIASTGIGIGDTIILGLQGVQFVEKDAGITTPGRSIDWELAFSQTLVVQILRDGNEIANLRIINATPTPAQSPVRREPHATPTQTPLKNSSLQLGDGPRWSSPAFLKRSRLSDGPFFEAGHDPLATNENAHDKKRRRKSYKDWNVWTYSKRTPSPEKEDMAQEDLAKSPTQSPIRRPSLPATPISPAKPQLCSIGGLSIQRPEETELRSGHEEEGGSQAIEVDDGDGIREAAEKKAAERTVTIEDFERDADYYDLYAGPDELPPEDTQYTFGGDTEENTEVEEDAGENVIEHQEMIELSSPAEIISNESDEELDIPKESRILPGLSSSETENQHGTIVSSTEEDTINEIDETTEEYEIAVGSTPDRRIRERSGTQEDPVDLDDDDNDSPAVMPPPLKLSFLQTEFPARAPGTLTPIGKEPRSPTLRPLDSSTLPIPSPFPGDRDGQLMSYLDRPSSSQPAQREAQEPSSEASYIVESSFYSSVSAADARAGLPHHESAFTDVRFTFGMDGSTFSRLKAPSKSPPLQDVEMEDEEDVREHVETQVAVENYSELHGNQEEPIAIHQDMLEEAEQNFTLDQENKENIFQGESESNLDEENVENSNVADEIAEEVEGKAAVEQEFALQAEMEQQLPSDMFDEFTNQDTSLADHDTAASLLSLSQTQLLPRLLTPPQPTQSEVIVLSSDSESSEVELDEDSNESESESESEAEVQSDADMFEEVEHETGLDQYVEDDFESVQHAGTTDVFSDESPTLQEESSVLSDDRSTYSRRLPTLSDDQQELDDEEPLPDYQDNIAPNPAITVEIIDLGSGSGSEDDVDDELPAHRESVVLLNDALIDEVVGEQSSISHTVHPAHVEVHSESLVDLGMRREVRPSAVAEGSSESASVERAPSEPMAANVVNEEQHIPTELHVDQTLTNTEYYEDDHFMDVNDEEEDDLMPDASSTRGTIQEPQREIPETMDLHPDIKMETIEDEGLFQMIPSTSSQPELEDEDSVMGPSAEIFIEVPEEGDKIGALTKKAVAATAPASNTRSKTKPAMSPIKDEMHAPRPSTRSRRSKTSLMSGSRVSLPLVEARSSRSTVSPAKDAIPASPYSLRSQSKFLSPTKSILSPNITVERGSSHRKRRGRQHSDPPSSPLADSFGKPEQGRLHMDFPDEFDYQPSQELGTQIQTQGTTKYANVAYIKDSEEGSIHSEHSITTASAPWSEDTEGFRVLTHDNHDEPITQIRDGVSMPSKSPSSIRGRSPEIKGRSKAMTSWKLPQKAAAVEKNKTSPQQNYSFITNDALSSSTDAPHSRSQMNNNHQKLRKEAFEISSDSEAEAEGSTTPIALSVAGHVVYPNLPPNGEGERDQASRPSSPLAEAEHIPSSPPPTQPTFTSINRHSLMDSNIPPTPNATQSFAQSQPSFLVAGGQVEQRMPITPQLTQRTSAGLRSLKASYEMDVELSTPDDKVFAELHGQPAPLTKSTPRRNTTGADVASPERSPSVHSEDFSESDDETQTLVNADPGQPSVGQPSIGLSTPISYYTPLKDLRYFLNRSSQFVENPDVLALVVSSSTPPKRADKGPKHWSTTISITDLSSFPTTTTAQIFRPYATALPVAEKGDVILLRSFTVKSLNRKVMLRSGEESAWCVWRYGKPVWGHKKGRWGDVQAREEIKGPEVEKGADEWGEVERVRGWWLSTIRQEFEAKDQSVAEHETQEASGHDVDEGKGKTRANEVKENGVEATNVET
jgi:hypothetical protein